VEVFISGYKKRISKPQQNKYTSIPVLFFQEIIQCGFPNTYPTELDVISETGFDVIVPIQLLVRRNNFHRLCFCTLQRSITRYSLQPVGP